MPTPNFGLMRQVLAGEMTTEEIRALTNRQDLVSAAVGFILRYRSTYLNHDGYLLRPYNKVLEEITQQGAHSDTLAAISLSLGLHRSTRRSQPGIPSPNGNWVQIIMPPELAGGDNARAELVAGLVSSRISEETPVVQRAVVRLLAKRFK